MNIIIVLNYNDYETTVKYIKAIKDYESLDKIIIVDNCSTDDSFNILSEYKSKKIDVIRTTKNEGYASGNNFGIKFAKRKYNPENIIISNPDVIVTDKSILRLCDFLVKESNVALVTGVIHDSTNKIISHFAWKLPSYRDVLIGCSIILSKLLNVLLSNSGNLYKKKALDNKKELLVDVVPGCFFVIKAEVFREVNYFDERTFLFQEENILAFKLKQRGYKSYILTSEKIVHEESISIKKSFKSLNSRKKINYDSSLIYLRDYLKVSIFKQYIYFIVYHLLKYENFMIVKLKNLIK